MQSSDRPQFDEQILLLCAGFNVPPSVRPEAYWLGLAKMSLPEFARCVEFALSEDGPDKIPSVREIWGLRVKMRRQGQARAVEAPYKPPEQSFGLRLVNQLFFAYLVDQRITKGIVGDIGLDARRKRCIELAAWIDGMKAEAMLPTLAECRSAFARSMAKVA